MRKAPMEKDFQKKVLRDLRLIPVAWFTKVNDRVTIGTPDILGFINGYGVAIELKTKCKLTALQHWNLEKIDAAKTQSFVVTPGNWKEVYEFLQSLVFIPPPPIQQLLKPARIPLWTLPARGKKKKPQPVKAGADK